MTDAYHSLHEHVDNDFSAIPLIFPDFEDIVSAVYTIDIQQRRLQSLRLSLLLCRLPTSLPSTSAVPSNAAPSTTPPACPHPTASTAKCWAIRLKHVGNWVAEMLVVITVSMLIVLRCLHVLMRTWPVIT